MTGSTWRVPTALLALGTVPVVAGSLRLAELSGWSGTMPSDPRYAASPLPVVVHVLGATVFAIVGAFQFSTPLRRRHPGWHRRAGQVLVLAGLTAAVSALWLNQFFPREGATREVVYPVRVVFGAAMVVTVVLGFVAARRRDFRRHRAWMVRSYAIGLVAGTQVLTIGLGQVVLGTGELATALLLVAAWAVNLAVAEHVIRRRVPGRVPASSDGLQRPPLPRRVP